MESVQIREVGLRDGIQLVRAVLPEYVKIDWCKAEFKAGVRYMEVTSFVLPAVMPQFADAERVARLALEIGGLGISALVPNLKGAQRALACGVRNLNFVVSASDSHNRANVRRSTAQSVEEFRRIVDHVAQLESPDEVTLAPVIATSFGCSIAGYVPAQDVLSLAEKLSDAGAREMMLADTVGYGAPGRVKSLFKSLRDVVGEMPVGAHFHDTRGLGLANVMAAIEAGVRRFDSSLGGLGGCPFAPGASGNVSTEDCAFLLESEGFDTGIDLDRLIAVRNRVATMLDGEELPGAISRAGVSKVFRYAKTSSGASPSSFHSCS